MSFQRDRNFMENLRKPLLGLLLCCLSGLAQAHEVVECPPLVLPRTAKAMESARQMAEDRGFLWQISRDGRVSYLYGTMHIGKPEWAWPGKKVMAALRASDTLALELDSTDESVERATQAAMASLRGNPIPAALTERVRKISESLCLPYEAIEKLAPEMQMAVLTMFYSHWLDLDAGYATDAVLAEIGHQQKKKVVSLETPQGQLEMLLMKDPADTARSVEKDAADIENGKAKQQIKRLSDAWANADYDTLDHYREWCDCDSEMDRKLMKRLLDDRNEGMAEKVDAMHRSGGKVFIAVGSLHMFGGQGLPALMTKRGYKVERIELKHSGKRGR